MVCLSLIPGKTKPLFITWQHLAFNTQLYFSKKKQKNYILMLISKVNKKRKCLWRRRPLKATSYPVPMKTGGVGGEALSESMN